MEKKRSSVSTQRHPQHHRRQLQFPYCLNKTSKYVGIMRGFGKQNMHEKSQTHIAEHPNLLGLRHII